MRIILALALAGALAACASGGGQPPPPPPHILLGAHVPWSKTAMAPVVALETSINRKLDLVKFYPSFPPWSAWDISFAQQIIAHGATPYLVIGQRVGQNGCAKFADVIAGKDDALFDNLALGLDALNAPVDVELLPEMTQADMDCAYPLGTPDPLTYITVYDHIAAIIRQYAPNVQLAWSPGQPGWLSGTIKSFYPGSDVVDVVGIHVYNSTSTTEPFPGALCADAAVFGKPFVIGETGAQGETDQLAWLGNVKTACPGLYAFNYFDAGGTQYNYTLTTPQAFAALKAIGTP